VLDGFVYVAYGGLDGDCGDYVGAVVAAPTVGTGPLRSFAVPTSREGGIWAPSSGTVENGRLLYAVGNGESTQAYDHSDSVLILSPQLHLVDSFSPAQWAFDNAADLDLGSMGPALVGVHVLAVGKSGVGYVWTPLGQHRRRRSDHAAVDGDGPAERAAGRRRRRGMGHRLPPRGAACPGPGIGCHARADRCRRTPALRVPVTGRRPRLPRHHDWSQRDHRYLTTVHP